MRLTKIENKGMNGYPIYTGSYGNICNLGDNRCTSMVHHELGQIEDIEEKYGVESTNDLDKRLKALEIIKEKGIDILEFRATRKAKTYNENTKGVYVKDYTDEEYNLLKEVLL